MTISTSTDSFCVSAMRPGQLLGIRAVVDARQLLEVVSDGIALRRGDLVLAGR